MMISLSLDSETVAEDAPPQRLVCVSYSSHEGSGLLDARDGLALVKSALSNPEVEIVGHNVAFDFAVFVKAGLPVEDVFKVYEQGRVFDTMIAAQLADIARGTFQGNRGGVYTLDALAQRYTGVTLDKDEEIRLKFGTLLGVPISDYPSRFSQYAVSDAVATLKVRQAISEVPDTRRQAAYAWWLYLMSLEGMPTDQKAVEALARRTIEEGGALIRKLLPLGFVEPQKDGTLKRKVKRTQEYAWSVGVRNPTDAAWGRARVRAREEGVKFRTSDVKALNPKEVSLAWDACEQSGDENLKSYARLGACLDVVNKDLEYLRRPVVHPRYGLAETGRTTCWDPNLQNLKTEGGIRECFRAPEGWAFGFADFSGLELATWAQCCYSLFGHSRLREMLNDRVDVHSVMAAELLHISYEEAVRRKKDPSDRQIYLARQTGKAFNFGCPGGGGVDTLKEYAYSAYEVKLSWEEAEAGRDLWYRMFPESRDYFDLVAREQSSGEPLAHLFSGRLRDGLNFPARANSRFQGLGGDAAKAAGWAVSRACYAEPSSPLFGSKPCVFVHDEIGALHPLETAEARLEEQERLMVQAAKQFIPDVRVAVESVLSLVWSKKAKWQKGEPPWDCS